MFKLDMLTSASPSAVAEAIHAYAVDFWRTACPYLPGAQWHDDDGLTWFITGVPFAPFNQVIRTDLQEDGLGERIDDMLARFRARRLPMLWSVLPSTRPVGLAQAIEARRPAAASRMPGMSIDIEALPDVASVPPGFRIERVLDVDALEQWSRAYADGFDMPEGMGRAFFDLYARIGFDDALPFRHFLGLLDGEPVATSLLFTGAGVAGVFAVGTVPDARRRGIGAAMTLAALREGRTMGYRVGVLYASEMGYGVYQRLGFRDHFTITQYLFPPHEAGR